MSEGIRVDYIGPFAVEVPVDIGWAVAVMHENDTVTRTCKGCGVSATSAVDRQTGKVSEVAITHRTQCRYYDILSRLAKVTL